MPSNQGPFSQPRQYDQESKAHYIRTLDGCEVRWVNCEFVAAITDDGPFRW